jgi:hypothetical protein
MYLWGRVGFNKVECIERGMRYQLCCNMAAGMAIELKAFENQSQLLVMLLLLLLSQVFLLTGWRRVSSCWMPCTLNSNR